MLFSGRLQYLLDVRGRKYLAVPRLIVTAPVVLGILLLSTLTPTVLFPPAAPADARKVFVIDHGTHSSVAIETESGELVRYAYGDLRYYANRDTSLASGAAALLWPTPATLGRGVLEAPSTLGNLKRQLRVVVEIIYELEVQGIRADQLMGSLDDIHAQDKSLQIAVPAYGLIFAPHPASYFWGNNSSSVIAGWLRELDVRVFGWGLIATWRLAA